MRKLRITLELLVLIGLIVFEAHTYRLQSDIAIVAKAPSLFGWDYRCADMVQAVNQLRHLGKDGALRVLKEYSDSEWHDTRIMLICRLLFVNPDGWKPLIATPVAQVDDEIASQFPHFPFAISHNVPSLLVERYIYMQDIDEPALNVCEGLQLIDADLSATNCDAAARSLIASDTFQDLYTNPKTVPIEARMVLLQAGVTNAVVPPAAHSFRIYPVVGLPPNPTDKAASGQTRWDYAPDNIAWALSALSTDGFKGDLSRLGLADYPLFSDRDIILYDLDNQAMTLKPAAAARLRQAQSGTPMVVLADEQPVYLATITRLTTSQTYVVPALIEEQGTIGNARSNTFRISPGSNWPGTAPDPRSDPRIRQALTGLNKLK